METPAVSELVDLSDRHADGLSVILWWVRGTLETYVTIEDYKIQGEPTTLFVPVPEGVSANNVFYHPFGYEATPHYEPAGITRGTE